MKQLRIIIVVFIAIAVGVFLFLTVGKDPEAILLERVAEYSQHLVAWVLLLCALILLSTLSGLPIFYLMVTLGFLLDFVPAMLISWSTGLISVMATFYLVRYAFTSYFKEKYGKKKLIRRINKRIRAYGWLSVAFSRGIYILPTNLINFSFPLSHISTRAYFLGTMLGLVPECLINVLTGYAVKHGVILLSSPGANTIHVLVIGGFVLLLALVLILLRIRQNRRKKFKRLKAVPYKG